MVRNNISHSNQWTQQEWAGIPARKGEKVSGILFPKKIAKKKRKKHKESILQNRSEGTCYLCMRMHQNYQIHRYREEHHIFPGNPGRKLSEAEGLKVYLCIDHHRTGPEAVHNNHSVSRILQQDAQRAYEKNNSREQFMKLFGKNYLEDE